MYVGVMMQAMIMLSVETGILTRIARILQRAPSEEGKRLCTMVVPPGLTV